MEKAGRLAAWLVFRVLASHDNRVCYCRPSSGGVLSARMPNHWSDETRRGATNFRASFSFDIDCSCSLRCATARASSAASSWALFSVALTLARYDTSAAKARLLFVSPSVA